ncbi:hypothetical protein FQN54_006567 [Arachnomyces sp. PD_36]|nr:hypothetical protein FQN54_006567 [Arachnomyces sp. PD_36]
MPRPAAQSRLETLTSKILARYDELHPLYRSGGISDELLATFDIVRLPFNFEILTNEHFNLGLNPPVLFAPRPASDLNLDPVDPQSPSVAFRDYVADNDLEPYDRASQIHRYLEKLTRRSGTSDLPELCGLRRIRLPNPFLLRGIPRDQSLPRENTWICQTVLESLPDPENPENNNMTANPHVTLMNVLACDGNEDSIQIGELASIVVAMNNRLCQPETYGEEDEENLFDNASRSEIRARKRAFPQEKRFPVLMISLMGPQHARLSYACMDGKTLMILQSRLYSFEVEADAPSDFFARFILSRPLTER